MSTRSLIGMQHSNGEIESIYCHWDGYPEHNGKILMEGYSNPDKIAQLIKLGDLSVLGTELGKKHPFDSHGELAQARNWCLAYGRDRGEEGIKARKYKDERQYRAAFEDSWAQYAYLFRDGQWWVISKANGELESISQILREV